MAEFITTSGDEIDTTNIVWDEDFFASLPTSDLHQIRELLQEEVINIDHQIREMEMEVRDDRTPGWYCRAEYARRIKNLDIQRLSRIIKEKRASEDRRWENRFVEVARETLPADIYENLKRITFETYAKEDQ